MTICPCCGFKSESTLSNGCKACGARPVGEPLPRPEHELPSYGRSLLLAVMGTLVVLTFLVETFVALTQRSSRSAKSTLAFFSMIPFDFWSWVSAAETAAWRLKWVMIPVSLLVLFAGRKLYRSIVQSPSRFCGVRYGRNGYIASAAVPLLVLVLIGVTVPERLEHRRLGVEAGANALAATFSRAIFEYGVKFEKLPNDLSDLRKLPDEDGSIAAALNSFDPVTYPNAYRPSADLATKQKPRTLRGAVIRNASISASPDDPLNEGLSFTNYDLHLPGPDKLMATEDDLILRDGVITKAADAPRRGPATKAATQRLQP